MDLFFLYNGEVYLALVGKKTTSTLKAVLGRKHEKKRAELAKVIRTEAKQVEKGKERGGGKIGSMQLGCCQQETTERVRYPMSEQKKTEQ